MLTFEITHQEHCRRLESYLRKLMPTSPPGYARKLIKNGSAKLNSTTATPDRLLAVRDVVTLKESATTAGFISHGIPPLDILYEDDMIMVVNKAHGLPMHRTAESEENLVEISQAYMIERGTPCKLYPVNRLDRGTSGAVILAKSSSSAAIYGRQVKNIGLDKLYLALVSGTPHESGIINEPLDEKESETSYRVILTGDKCALLAVTPISGRMHQIRRHLSMIGHPVMADKRYGGGDIAECSGFALHSFRTVLAREEAGAITVSAPLSDEMLHMCEQHGICHTLLLETILHLL